MCVGPAAQVCITFRYVKAEPQAGRPRALAHNAHYATAPDPGASAFQRARRGRTSRRCLGRGPYHTGLYRGPWAGGGIVLSAQRTPHWPWLVRRFCLLLLLFFFFSSY